MQKIFDLFEKRESDHIKLDRIPKFVKDGCSHPLWLEFADSEIEEAAKELPELKYLHYCVCAKCNTIKFTLSVKELEFGEHPSIYGTTIYGGSVQKVNCGNNRNMVNIMFNYYNTNFMSFLDETKDWPCTEQEKAKYFLIHMEEEKKQYQKTLSR